MKFLVSSVAMMGGGVAASGITLEAKTAKVSAAIHQENRLQAEQVVAELRNNGVEFASSSDVSTSSLASSKGFLIQEQAYDAQCSGATLKLGSAMGYCFSNTTAQDSYYFSCDSNATHVVRSMVYCSTDTTCTGGCGNPFEYGVFEKDVCTTSGATVWNYNAGASCSSDDDPWDDLTDGWINLEYATSSECAGEDEDDVYFFAFTPLNECLDYLGNLKATTCGSSAVQYNSYSDSACTTMTGNNGTYNLPICELDSDDGEGYESGLCAASSDDGDDDVCFHVDTKIDYKGVQYTYEELKAGKEPECSVPHSPSSKGVVISTSCGKTVRVTDTHLMATTKGFQLAYSLKPGDVMFGDYHKDMCTVTSVEKEKATQQYFGLNCVHSEVLASGLRASTFGDFHTLPSWYMSYVGGLVGTETASSLGGYIAEWFFQK